MPVETSAASSYSLAMYIAMNQFRVRPEAGAEFEQAWRERESFLATVPGFQTFHLLRGPEEDGARLYASHTVWKDEAAFTAWTQRRSTKRTRAAARRCSSWSVRPASSAGPRCCRITG
jgi:heme-degrading monooxygenase HmoA